MSGSIFESYQWIVDFSVGCSIVGLGLSVYLVFATNKLKEIYVGKVRYSEGITELESIWENIYSKQSDYDENKQDILIELTRARGIVLNFHSKLTGKTEKKECKDFLKLFDEKKHFFITIKKTTYSKNECENILIQISGIVSILSEHDKDFKIRN